MTNDQQTGSRSGGLFVFVAGLLAALIAAPATAQVSTRINRVLRKLPAGVSVGMLVVDLDAGTTLFSRNADRPLIPASNAKIVTVGAALATLGSDFHFSTEVYLRGSLSGGVLDGDLVLVGTGDPCFSGRFYDGNAGKVLDDWAKLFVRAGIKKVTGGILLDTSAMAGPGVHPEWPRDQLDNWYCAPVAAFNLNDNCIEIDLSAGRGSRVSVAVRPRHAFPRLSNRCTVGGAHRPRIHFPPKDRGAVSISGSFGRGRPTARYLWTAKSPSLLFGRVLREKLRRAGVTVGAPRIVTTPIADKGTPFVRHRSTIARAIGPVLKRSQNLFAEALYRAVGRAEGKPGTFASGKAAVESWLASIDARGTSADGSGLARSNRLSPRALVGALRAMYASTSRKVLLDSLPIAGVDGSLRNRMKRGPAKGNVFAKTGYIRSVSALSGFVKTTGGRTLAFSMLFNGFQGKRVKMSNATIKRDYQDAICQVLAALR